MLFIRFKLYLLDLKKNIYRKTCTFASLFLRDIINIFILVIFSNIITYLDTTFKEEQNFNFIYQVSDGVIIHNLIEIRDITLTLSLPGKVP